MTPTDRLDLTGIPCPKNTAMALIRLELLDVGESLEIIVDDGEPVRNLLASFELEGGLTILERARGQGGSAWKITVRKET